MPALRDERNLLRAMGLQGSTRHHSGSEVPWVSAHRRRTAFHLELQKPAI
jgi:hypothetical protein